MTIEETLAERAAAITAPRLVQTDWSPPADMYDAVVELVRQFKQLVTNDTVASTAVGGIRMTHDPEVEARDTETVQQLLVQFADDLGIGRETPAVLTYWVVRRAYDEFAGLGVLGGPWRDADVTEICVDAWDRITVEAHGRLQPTTLKFDNLEHVQDTARRLARIQSDRALSNSSPVVSAQLPNARVTLVYGTAVVADGVSICIRKFKEHLGMAALVQAGALTPEMAAFLGAAVRARKTILVSGGTGAGKTTFINALCETIPKDQRLITIEDAFELSFESDNVVRWQSKEKASIDDQVELTQGDLLVAALRMRPDRIIVGEIRKPGAASLFMEAVNTGHDGAITSIHATDAELAVNFRLVNLLLQHRPTSPVDTIVGEISQTLDFVVQVVRENGVRYVNEITLVKPTFRGTDVETIPVFTGKLVKGKPVFTNHQLAVTGHSDGADTDS